MTQTPQQGVSYGVAGNYPQYNQGYPVPAIPPIQPAYASSYPRRDVQLPLPGAKPGVGSLVLANIQLSSEGVKRLVVFQKERKKNLDVIIFLSFSFFLLFFFSFLFFLFSFFFSSSFFFSQTIPGGS